MQIHIPEDTPVEALLAMLEMAGAVTSNPEALPFVDDKNGYKIDVAWEGRMFVLICYLIDGDPSYLRIEAQPEVG